MTEHAVSGPAGWDIAWPVAALGAGVATFGLTVVMPPAGFLAGVAGLLALCLGSVRRRSGLLTAVPAGVVAAVVCYLGIWLVHSVVDPGLPAESGSSVHDLP